ncbi:cryptochrome/photolyase family protein [Salinarimonas ramus]|uniref:Deoxyribodipyrimidine photo-lyase n=1 Tax=Salinarimonas ramus TaxID=690164 RepID=A0A917Q4U6_9HYPH|nr:deoxyribodipyrimidine photo-lyase [Salinarimonas ramus]GGK22540.1 deoxyribodipyrimidine photo-lyase [Salinarimonas ramus]
MPGPALVWFREDLRVGDNPALTHAVETGAPVLCLYLFDEESPEVRPLGGASRWFLHGSLTVLAERLAAIGGELLVMRGAARTVIPRVVEASGASHVLWNRRYGAEREIDAEIKARLKEAGVEARSCKARLLYEPGEVTTKTGGLYKVFTPYRNATLAYDPPPPPLPAPERIEKGSWPAAIRAEAIAIADLDLEPTKPDWAAGLRETWTRGEAGAQARLASFLDGPLSGYAGSRNRPDLETTSMLSAHLRFGDVSPRQIVHAALHARDAGRIPAEDYDMLRSELGWRDFSHQLLFAQPDIARTNMMRSYDAFPWRQDEAALAAWQRGRTGYPFVDAGMRQLWTTGFMHNRVRMVVGSFLVKHLLLDWRLGEDWFWDTLCDADPANNAASWQWVAGSGADASPYYRVFNPVTQGEKFDPAGDYVRRWVPELAGLPNTYVHRPWDASRNVLERANVTLGRSYPLPIVDHDEGRRRALDALAQMKKNAA